MLINHTKIKEMIVGNAKVDKIPALFNEGKKIERVTEFTLLGVHISNDFCWRNQPTTHLYSLPWYSETDCNIALLISKDSSAMI